MNKFGKTIYRIGIAFLIIGLVIAIIGVAFGGNIVNNIKFGDAEDYTDITSIQIEYDAGELAILEGDTFRIDAKNVYKDGFESTVDNGVWTIKNKFLKSKYWFGIFPFNGFNWGDNATKVTVYIPDSVLLEKCKMQLGAGKVSVDNLNADNFELKIGAGEANIDNLNTGKLDINVGAGKVAIKNLTAKDAILECGAGSINIDGEITGDSALKNGVGDIRLILKGSITDYDYRIKVGLGSAKINDKNYSGTSDTTLNNPGSNGKFEIDCVLGEVTLQINE
jgi:hypothetical protein